MGDRVCVLGGGNGGQSMAADFARRGWDVTLFELPRFGAALEGPLQTNELVLTERGETCSVPVRVTTDIAEALSDVRVVNVVVPANGHDDFFEAMLPHLTSQHLVVVWSGRLGALRLMAMAAQAGVKDLQVAEVNTLAYGARLDGPGHPHILYRATQMFASACPVSATPDLLAELQEFYPEIPIRDAGSVLGAGLANSSLLVLPTGTVLNAGGIDNAGGEFYLTRDGLTTHVTRVIGALNREFVAVGAAFGVAGSPYEKSVLEGPASVEAANFRGEEEGALLKLSGPESVDHRYLHENIPFGLVPIAGLGRVVDVPTPVIDGLIELSVAMLGEGLRDGQRSLASLGLAGRSAEEILNLLEHGYYNEGAS